MEILGLAGAQLFKHVVGDGHLAGRVADAGADTAEVAAAHLVDDGTQAVVASMAAAHLNAHVAGGNIELVVDYEQLLGLDLVLAAELGDGTARGIHVRLRLDQHNLALAAIFLGVVDVDERDLGAGLVFPVRDAGLTGQLVDCLKAGVVAGLGIFLTRVAKPGNHANLERLCSCHVLPFVDLSSAMVSDPVTAVKWRAIEAVWWRLGGRQKPRWAVCSDTYKTRAIEALDSMP